MNKLLLSDGESRLIIRTTIQGLKGSKPLPKPYKDEDKESLLRKIYDLSEKVVENSKPTAEPTP